VMANQLNAHREQRISRGRPAVEAEARMGEDNAQRERRRLDVERDG
jgi:hypothetical protein